MTTPTSRTYTPQTVIRAQRRVLTLVRGYLQQMTTRERQLLRTDGRGLMTIQDLLTHIDAATTLKARQ